MTSPAILIVDDNPLQLEVLTLQLAHIGHSDIVFAHSGAQALQQFEHLGDRIGIIISDLAMPDMDGLVLMRHLAQRGFAGAFILLSGATDEILSSAAGLAQAHHLNLLGVLAKPCHPERLRELLALHQQAAADGAGADRPAESFTAHRLSQALTAGEFVPWYQPVVEIDSGQVTSVEALARWHLKDGNWLGPVRFIPAIEAAGLSDDLFFSMAGSVLADLASWRRRGIPIKAAINMSMDSALNLELPEHLLSLVHASGLKAEDLTIDVTESKLMVERCVAMETLTRLSMMGFSLSIDDFGTGFSSLVQLVDLPFKELKVDGSFVRRALHERKADAILRLSIMIGAAMHLNVVAEGVETAAQLDYLSEVGIVNVQGYHLARPMPFDALTAFLRKSPVFARARYASRRLVTSPQV